MVTGLNSSAGDEMRDVQRFIGHMSLESGAGTTVGESRIRLLEEIGRKGSITSAARAVPLSYKAAWNAIDAMNNLALKPLVIRVAGGRRGGGTRLTDYGQRLVSMYRALQSEYEASLHRLSEEFLAAEEAGLPTLQSLHRQISMKTSARNRFSGVVSRITAGMVENEVHINIGQDDELVATVTAGSVENLGLEVGREVVALVKASAVVLTVERGLRFSARNQLWGKVTTVQKGAVNNEVTIELSSGRTITSIITLESCTELGLEPGVEVCALFKAGSVIMAVYQE